MKSDQIEKQLKDIFSAIFSVKESEINDSSSMNSISTWDSMKHMELIYAIEENFGITLIADEIVEMTNMLNIKRILKEKGLNINHYKN